MVGLLLQAGYFCFTYLSLKQGMSAGGLALITSLQPILIGLLAPAIAHERVDARRWAGLALGVTGAALVIVAKASIDVLAPWGLLFAVSALLCITGGTLYEKRFGTQMHPVASNLVQYSVGLAVSAPLAAQGIPRRTGGQSTTVNNAPRFMVANPFAFAPADSAPAVAIGTGMREEMKDVVGRDYTVIEQTQMNDALTQYGYPKDAILSPALAVTLAKNIQARFLVNSTLSKGAKGYTVTARLTVPDSAWVMVTSAPATGWPSAPTTVPPTPAEVLCAKTGAAASATIRPSDSFESRTLVL